MGHFNSLSKHSKEVIAKNRDFYGRNRKFIDPWLAKTEGFEDSYRKLEWHNRKGQSLKIKEHLIQFRPSGIRLKTADYAPALVAIGQIPVQGWNNRYIPLSAMRKLQCFPKTHKTNGKRRSFQALEERSMIRALGNAVNVRVVAKIARSFIR